MEIKKLIEDMGKVSDPRRQWGNKRHQLVDILVIGICAIMCGGEDFTDMETLGIEKEEWLRTFLALPNGIPDSDTFQRVYEKVKSLRGWGENIGALKTSFTGVQTWFFARMLPARSETIHRST